MSMTAPLGIHDINNEAYHSGPGVSKSGLWKLYKKTPEHFIGAVEKETASKDFGAVCHMAVLEPHLLESTYAVIPPDAPRRPTEAQWNAKKPSPESVAAMNWWRQWNAANAGKKDISQADWDEARTIRDKLQADPLVQKLVKDAVFERAAYWIDEETGELCRCKPDIYSPGLRMMADVKTCRDASARAFGKAVDDYGYHVQDAWYGDGWTQAGGGDVDAFVFIAIESEAPYVFQIYELEPQDQEDGRTIYRHALRQYAVCKATNQWPGYGGGVKPIARPDYARAAVRAKHGEAVS